MQRTWTPPLRWVFAAATLFGIFSTLQSYRLTTLNLKTGMDIQEWRLLVLNLVYWYVPAILTPTLFRLADRFRIDGARWIRALVLHVFCAVGFSAVHCAGMIAIRSVLWEDGGKAQYVSWPLYVQRIYLQNLDWTLMVYAAIVGLSYAVTYYRESQARAVKEAQLETNLAQARLRTLEAELHPHFRLWQVAGDAIEMKTMRFGTAEHIGQVPIVDRAQGTQNTLLVEPGATTTEVAESITDPNYRKAMQAHVGKEGAMKPEDVAAAIVFVVSLPRRANVSELLIRPTIDVAPL